MSLPPPARRFIDEMYKWSEAEEGGRPAKVLDVGCGIGGTSRYLAKKLGPGTEVVIPRHAQREQPAPPPPSHPTTTTTATTTRSATPPPPAASPASLPPPLPRTSRLPPAPPP